MKKLIIGLVTAWTLSTLAVSQPVAAANPKCPKCKMALSTTKKSTHPAAVKVNGKTYYCCAPCAARAAANAKKPASSTAAEKPVKCPKCNMAMSKTKTTLKSYPVKVNGKTYYCCTICPRH